MKMLRQLDAMLGDMPPWVQFAIATFLTAYAIASVYGRFNVSFGKRIFSKIPQEEIQSNVGHIISYTVVPCIVWLGFLGLLAIRHQLF